MLVVMLVCFRLGLPYLRRISVCLFTCVSFQLCCGEIENTLTLATLCCTLFRRPTMVPNSDKGRGGCDEVGEVESKSCDDECLCIRKGWI